MSSLIPPRQVTLAFSSLTAITQFKHECTCPDFYIDRDKLTFVGSVTPAQRQIAVEKYNAKVLDAGS